MRCLRSGLAPSLHGYMSISKLGLRRRLAEAAERGGIGHPARLPLCALPELVNGFEWLAEPGDDGLGFHVVERVLDLPHCPGVSAGLRGIPLLGVGLRVPQRLPAARQLAGQLGSLTAGQTRGKGTAGERPFRVAPPGGITGRFANPPDLVS